MRRPPMRELFTNSDNRLSTTATIQFFGFIVLAGTLLYSVFLDGRHTSDMYFYFAMYCGGLTATKGAVSAYRDRGNRRQPRDYREGDHDA